MKGDKSISVVIPSFNRAGLLERALESVMSQTRPADEIIVVDDGSSDSTSELIKSRYQDSVRYIYQENRGVSSARNRGIIESSAEWIAFLDSDDQWKPEKLQTQVEALSNQPDYHFCHTNEIWIRRGKRVNEMTKHRKSGGHIFGKCLPLCVISPSSALIKKSVFEEIGLFDEELPACEDYDLWLRYCARYPVLFIQTPLLIKYGGHEDQLSGKYRGMDLFRLRSMLRLVLSGVLDSDQIKLVATTFKSKHDILARGARKHGNTQMLAECEKLLRVFNENALMRDAQSLNAKTSVY